MLIMLVWKWYGRGSVVVMSQFITVFQNCKCWHPISKKKEEKVPLAEEVKAGLLISGAFALLVALTHLFVIGELYSKQDSWECQWLFEGIMLTALWGILTFFFYLCPPVPFSCRGFCRVQSDAFLCLPVIISEHEITQLKAVNQHWGPRENYYAFKLWIILKILSLRTKRRL